MLISGKKTSKCVKSHKSSLHLKLVKLAWFWWQRWLFICFQRCWARFCRKIWDISTKSDRKTAGKAGSTSEKFFLQKSHLKKFKDSIFSNFFVWNSKPQVPHVIFSQYLAFFAVESSQILNFSDLVVPLAQKSMNFSNICP